MIFFWQVQSSLPKNLCQVILEHIEMVYSLIGFRQVYVDKQYYYLIACFAFMQNHLKKKTKKNNNTIL